MHLTRFALTATALLGMFSLTSCQSEPKGKATMEVIETPHSAVEVETFTTTARVTAIDANNRKLTLTQSDGGHFTCKAGLDVVNFNQIKIGDRVKATVTEEFAVALLAGGQPLSAANGSTVALAPIGAKPGEYVADTASTTARVEQVWPSDHEVRLLFVSGDSKIVKVGKGIDLSTVQPGNDVMVQMAESVAIAVEKP